MKSKKTYRDLNNTFFHFRLRSKSDGTIYPRCGVTALYTQTSHDRKFVQPSLWLAFCSPMDNYSKARGRRICSSCFRDWNENTRVEIPSYAWSQTGEVINVRLNDKTLFQAIDGLWQNQLYEWHKMGIVLGPKKNHRPPNWMNYELVLTKKNRKKSKSKRPSKK